MSKFLRLYISEEIHKMPLTPSLDAHEEEPDFNRALRTEDSLFLYMDDKFVAGFEGIQDISTYKIVYRDDESPYTVPASPPANADRLAALESAMLALMVGGVASV